MIIARTIAALCFTASLAACGQQTSQTPTPAPAAAQTGKPDVGSAPAAAPSSGITAAALIGRWGDNGDCTKDIVFDANGTFRSYTGGSGTWSLNGDIITMSGSGGTFTLRVQSLNDQQLLIGNPDGSIGISQRC
jgi:hypothetical protein